MRQPSLLAGALPPWNLDTQLPLMSYSPSAQPLWLPAFQRSREHARCFPACHVFAALCQPASDATLRSREPGIQSISRIGWQRSRAARQPFSAPVGRRAAMELCYPILLKSVRLLRALCTTLHVSRPGMNQSSRIPFKIARDRHRCDMLLESKWLRCSFCNVCMRMTWFGHGPGTHDYT